MAARWGGGRNGQHIHIIDVVTKLTGDRSSGRGPQEGLEHILSERTTGYEPVLAMSRKGDGAMGP